ncbi:hypothetical protein AMS68_004057 [Peltaster fructicola]|uniref:Uncharacterized protein n=1 Tax=Peltaster fructicola TaxID=286661 RepID=A0A6H0XVR8_9PEZI|nr:hypothetical protein AMS68_004057 [Peltaster fructicola]
MAPHIQFTADQALSPNATFDAGVLAGKSIVVTGGTSVGARSEHAGKRLLDEFGPKQLRFVQCDIMSWSDQLKLFKTALAESPARTLDIVFANAGISGPDDVFLESPLTPEGDPVKPNVNVIETDIVGTMYTIKLANHYLPRQPAGADRDRLVLITGSLAGYVDRPGRSTVCCCQGFGVRGIMRCMRRTGPNHGVRYNILAPWYIRSKVMSAEVADKIMANGIDLASMDDAATAILHIASDVKLNGRTIAVVPRSETPKGYLDVKQDDIDDDKMLAGWQRKCDQAASHV